VIGRRKKRGVKGDGRERGIGALLSQRGEGVA